MHILTIFGPFWPLFSWKMRVEHHPKMITLLTVQRARNVGGGVQKITKTPILAHFPLFIFWSKAVFQAALTKKYFLCNRYSQRFVFTCFYIYLPNFEAPKSIENRNHNHQRFLTEGAHFPLFFLLPTSGKFARFPLNFHGCERFLALWEQI